MGRGQRAPHINLEWGPPKAQSGPDQDTSYNQAQVDRGANGRLEPWSNQRPARQSFYSMLTRC